VINAIVWGVLYPLKHARNNYPHKNGICMSYHIRRKDWEIVDNNGFPLLVKALAASLVVLVNAFAQTDTVFLDSGRIAVALDSECTLAATGTQGLDYFPDEGTNPLPTADGTVSLLLAARQSTYILYGGNSTSYTGWTGAVEVLRRDSLSNFDNGYAGISGVWTAGPLSILQPIRPLYGFYHAEDQRSIPLIPNTQIPGFYACIALARSIDSGKTWTKLGQLITSAAAKIINDSTHTDQGAAEPGVVADPSGEFIYITYTDHSHTGGVGTRICLARIGILNGTIQGDSCRKWDGNGFTLPAKGGADIPVLIADPILGGPYRGDVLEAHPVWCAFLKRYLIVFGVNTWNEPEPLTSGTYISTSTDMIHWSQAVQILKDYSVPYAGKSLRWEASILWTDRFQSQAWFIYGMTPKWPDGQSGQGHHLAGRRIHVWQVGNEVRRFQVRSGQAPIPDFCRIIAGHIAVLPGNGLVRILDLQGKELAKIRQTTHLLTIRTLPQGIYYAEPGRQRRPFS
jgi:hypothetical protein